MIERRKTVFDILDEATPDIEEEKTVEEKVVDSYFEEEEPVLVFKCKPCWNFQSIEFEIAGSVNDAIEMYNVVLQELKAISPEQPTLARKVPSKKLPKNPATDKQKEIMDRYKIPYDKYTSREEARDLINKSIQESK